MVKLLGYGAKNLSETEFTCGAFDLGSAGKFTAQDGDVDSRLRRNDGSQRHPGEQRNAAKDDDC